MSIGTQLKFLRNKSGLTQEEAADRLGVTRQAISNWERGQSLPDIEMIKKISQLYNVKVDTLLAEEEETNESSQKEFSNERRYIGYFIIVAFLAIACTFPIFGIASCLLAFYLSRKLNIKSVLVIIFTVMALIISIWNSWSFINANFAQNGAATVTPVAVGKQL